MRFIICFALAVFLFGCQKESSQDQNPVNSSNRVKTYTETITSTTIGNSSTTFQITYDNSGRLISAVSAANPGDRFVYGYPSSGKFTMDLFNGGLLSIHEDFYLNAASLIDSTFQYNDTQDSSTEKFVYNSSQVLTQIKRYQYSKSTGGILDNVNSYGWDANGNLVREEDLYGELHTYEYYPDVINYYIPFLGTPLENPLFKKGNLLKKHLLSISGFVEISISFTYTFDGQNRLTMQKGIADDGTVIEKTYTYY